MEPTSKHSEWNEQAFMTELYKKHERLMFFVARQYTSDIFELEEIVQIALVGLLQKGKTLRGLNTYAKINYIATAVRNSAINYKKKRDRDRRRQVSLETVPETSEVLQLPSADTFILLAESKKELIQAYQKLSEDDQYLLSAKYILGLSDEELAQQMLCKPSSIRMKLTRVRRRLLAELKKEGSVHE